MLRFRVAKELVTDLTYRVPQKTNWEGYKNDLSTGLKEIHYTIRNIDNLERAAELTTKAINKAYEDNCPLKSKKTKNRVPWWNEGLNSLRSIARREFNRAKKSNNWEEYRKALTEFNKRLRKAKRSSWKSFCESLEEVSDISRVRKALSKEFQGNNIGALKKSDGTTTVTFNETLEVLMSTHFPGCREPTEGREEGVPLRRADLKGDSSLIHEIISPERIEWAVGTFQSFKSPGPDGVFPALIQQGLGILLQPLVQLFRTSLLYGYVPSTWRKVRVVFIPKGGGKPLDQAKSYRPISLSSFLLKTMEKLIDHHIRMEVLQYAPLHKHQYAYQKGKSTVTALHQVVKTIEGAFEAKEIALGVFMDIEGAFDNAAYESMVRSLRRKGTHTRITNWVQFMLEERQVSASIGSSTHEVGTIRGCPQGGVLSPLLWSLVVDELLVDLSRAGFNVVGYADDIAVIVSGKHDITIGERMQVAVNITSKWCLKEGLNVNPGKTIAVPFTRRRKLNVPPINMHGTALPLTTEVTYLGVVLDQRLNWDGHLTRITNKATKVLWCCRQMVGKTWGLSPKSSNWIYNQVVKPGMLYSAVVWWRKVDQSTAIAKLAKVQRLACLNTIGAMKTTPTAAMEILLSMTPLQVAIKEEAMKQALKLHERFTFKEGNLRGHLVILKKINPTISMTAATDSMTPMVVTGHRYTVHLGNREKEADVPECIRRDSQKWFTASSWMETGVGSGVVGPRCKMHSALAPNATVFQAGVNAVNLAVGHLLNRSRCNQRICILSNNQAVLTALKGNTFKSKMLFECYLALNELALENKVFLIWSSEQMGMVGSRRAGEEARIGAAEPFIGPAPNNGFNQKDFQQIINCWVNEEVNKNWNKIPGLKHSKKFLNPTQNWGRDALKLNRKDLRILCEVLTGHSHCNYLLKKLKLVDDENCRYCCEEAETMEHLITECPALCQIRKTYLGKPQIGEGDYQKLSIRGLIGFKKEVDLL